MFFKAPLKTNSKVHTIDFR